MALFTPSESPAVVVKEIDLTGGVPNVQSTTGAIVSPFRWGPVEERKLIANEAGLVDTFASPDSSGIAAAGFLSCVQYLRYSSSLQVVRMGAKYNSKGFPYKSPASHDSVGALSDRKIKNLADWTSQETTRISDGYSFFAKYPGALGNSLKVSMCPPDSDVFESWTYKSSFDTKPGTSTFASGKSARLDEIHMVVIDDQGAFSGTKGTILETYPYLSVAKNAKGEAGISNFAKDVINQKSQYIWMANFDSNYSNAYTHVNTANILQPDVSAGSNITSQVAGTDADSGDVFYTRISDTTASNFTFSAGEDSNPGIADYLTGFDLFEDKDTVEIDFLIAPGCVTRNGLTTIVNDLVSTAQSTRKDCVVVCSPTSTSVVNPTNVDTAVSNAVADGATLTQSSYLIMDGT